MNEAEFRLECLKLAVSKTTDITAALATAGKYVEFVGAKPPFMPAPPAGTLHLRPKTDKPK